MPRTRTVFTHLAMAVAVGTIAASGATPAMAATAAPPANAPVTSLVGCASLTSNSAGKATVKNICGLAIDATVSVDWSWDPACKRIAGGKSATFTWDSRDGRAEYAYEC
ncbi:hypothetical protein [Streptomyces prasinus]|uniref:hypothetical protein n=1 Tax=Streptomyces prasinus TaxID=67345 RepID=UPI0033BE3A7E